MHSEVDLHRKMFETSCMTEIRVTQGVEAPDSQMLGSQRYIELSCLRGFGYPLFR